MEIFVRVVEAGQLTRAAQALSLSKSSVSHALNDLETYLGLQLIRRNNRSWQITDAGQSYYEKCKSILADVAEMEDRARQASQVLSGHIRLSAPDTFGSYTLTPIIAKFMELHPNVVIEMNLTERMVDLIEERVDIAFRAGVLKDSSLVARLLGEAEMVVCASPSYLQKYGAPETHLDLKNHKCLRYSRSPNWTLFKGQKRFNFMPKDHVVTNSGEVLREFAIRGQGICYIPTMLVSHALKKGRLIQTLKAYKGAALPVYAVRTGDDRVPTRVLALLEFVAEELKGRQRDIAELV
jgi:DNA-binding transcriptional LysR family regulator